MVVLGEKLGGEPMDRSASMLGIVSGALFLASSRVHPMLLMASERLPRTWTAHKKCTYDIRRLTWEAYMSCVLGYPLQGVHRFESPQLLDMSNRLFVTVFT
jgi:hypothetical protein